jgi:hypothetical protein
LGWVSSTGDTDAVDDEVLPFITGDGTNALRNSTCAGVSILLIGVGESTERIVPIRLVGDGERSGSSENAGFFRIDSVSSIRLGEGLGFRFTGDGERLCSVAVKPLPFTAKEDPNADFDGEEVGEIRGNRRLAAVGDETEAELAFVLEATDADATVFSLAGLVGVAGGLRCSCIPGLVPVLEPAPVAFASMAS